jgi:hypothetical protein
MGSEGEDCALNVDLLISGHLGGRGGDSVGEKGGGHSGLHTQSPGLAVIALECPEVK